MDERKDAGQNGLNEEARRKAAADNLARRKQEMKQGGRVPRKKRKGWMALPARVRRRISLLILILLILLIIVLIARGCGGGASQETGGDEPAAASESQKDEGLVIGLKGSEVQLVLQGDPYVENGAFAIDRETGPVAQDQIRIKGKVDTSKPGDYEVKYKVKENGNKAEAIRTVRVLPEGEFGDKARNVPVLMYHWVYTADDVPDNLDGNWMLDTKLEEQLKYLTENSFYYPGWKELRAWVDGEISLPAKCVVLTFDDGKKAFLKYGVPVLERYKVPATSFMICWEKNDGADKVREYASPYIDFESHTYAMHQKSDVPGHKGIAAAMSKEEISEDLEKASGIVGSNDAIAYPYGDYTDDLLSAARDNGILCGFTTEYERVYQGADPMKLPRVRVSGDESFDNWKNSIN